MAGFLGEGFRRQASGGERRGEPSAGIDDIEGVREAGRAKEGEEDLADAVEGVAVAAEVSEVNLAPTRLGNAGEKFEGILVGEVAVASADALFDGKGPMGVLIEKVVVVIGLQNEGIHFADAFAHELGHVAEVGDPGEAAAGFEEVAGAPGKDETDGVVGVVGDRERSDLEILKVEIAAGGEDLPVEGTVHFGLEGASGVAVGEKAQVGMAGKATEAAGVILVLVGEEDAVDGLDGDIHGGEQAADLAAGKPGVDKDAGTGGLKEGAVAGAVRAKDVKTGLHRDQTADENGRGPASNGKARTFCSVPGRP